MKLINIRTDNRKHINIRTDNIEHINIRTNNIEHINIRTDNIRHITISTDNIRHINIRTDNWKLGSQVTGSKTPQNFDLVTCSRASFRVPVTQYNFVFICVQHIYVILRKSIVNDLYFNKSTRRIFFFRYLSKIRYLLGN